MSTDSEKVIKGELMYQKINALKVEKIDSKNWLTYYIDEATNEKWIKEYLYPEMQGGGPPQLRRIDKFPWE